MKKILIIIVLALLLTIAYCTVFNGYSIGKINVLSITDMANKNSELDSQIESTAKLKTVSYSEKMSDLSKNAKELIKQKKEYTELVEYSKSSDIEKANQIQQYDVEVLWTKVGLHATNNNVKLKFEIVDSSSVSEKNVKYFNLNFTVTGTYISITDFIADLERDAKLSFSIDNFQMIPSSTQDTSSSGRNLQATFTVKDIALNLNTTTLTSEAVKSSTSSNETETNQTEQTNKEDSTSK